VTSSDTPDANLFEGQASDSSEEFDFILRGKNEIPPTDAADQKDPDIVNGVHVCHATTPKKKRVATQSGMLTITEATPCKIATLFGSTSRKFQTSKLNVPL
jgi:hypothetical protein